MHKLIKLVFNICIDFMNKNSELIKVIRNSLTMEPPTIGLVVDNQF